LTKPSADITDTSYRERVLRARRTPPEEKLWGGLRMFEEECELVKDCLRRHFPDASEACILAILRELIPWIYR
jgi:hypothetical protein